MEKDLKQTNPEEDQGKPQEETVESQNLETNWDESVETFDELNFLEVSTDMVLKNPPPFNRKPSSLS